MSSQAGVIVTLPYFILVYPSIIVLFMRMRAVRGSKYEYRLTTLAISIFSAKFVSLILIVGASIVDKDFLLGSIFLANALFTLFILWKLSKGKDWFNDQRKNLKRKFKNLRQRLKFSPMTAPSPV